MFDELMEKLAGIGMEAAADVCKKIAASSGKETVGGDIEGLGKERAEKAWLEAALSALDGEQVPASSKEKIARGLSATAKKVVSEGTDVFIKTFIREGPLAAKEAMLNTGLKVALNAMVEQGAALLLNSGRKALGCVNKERVAKVSASRALKSAVPKTGNVDTRAGGEEKGAQESVIGGAAQFEEDEGTDVDGVNEGVNTGSVLAVQPPAKSGSKVTVDSGVKAETNPLAVVDHAEFDENLDLNPLNVTEGEEGDEPPSIGSVEEESNSMGDPTWGMKTFFRPVLTAVAGEMTAQTTVIKSAVSVGVGGAKQIWKFGQSVQGVIQGKGRDQGTTAACIFRKSDQDEPSIEQTLQSVSSNRK